MCDALLVRLTSLTHPVSHFPAIRADILALKTDKGLALQDMLEDIHEFMYKCVAEPFLPASAITAQAYAMQQCGCI